MYGATGSRVRKVTGTCRVQTGMQKGKWNSGSAQRSHDLRFLWDKLAPPQPSVLSLLPPGSYHSPAPHRPLFWKKKKGKERLLLPSLPTQVWPLADVAGRPQRAASPAPLPAPSSGSGPTAIPKLAEAALRRMRAVGQPRAQPLPALWWKCGSGSLLCSPAGRGGWWRGPALTRGPGGGALPAAQRAAGGRAGAGDGSRPLFPSVASVCPQSGADWVAQDPSRGGSARVPDRARVGAEAGSSAWESGTWGPGTPPLHRSPARP